ncbi:MAG: hypothetical protein NWF05_02535 [Candidatus Bathyarchaeota archaeon]|nr:hypothetical protein [Candidatus Bathyarchaeota archaeon]
MFAASSSSMFGEYLELFAHTEIFIFVFMEIATKIDLIQRVIFKMATVKDYVVFVALFGLFSVFGTYIGTTQSSGAITNIRDLAPIIAGLVGGPVIGLAVGLIGGIHRFCLGGVSSLACALSTVLAGLLAGLVYHLIKGKLLGIIPGILLGVAIEVLHGALALLLIQPYSTAVEIVMDNIPQMIIAVSLGVGIGIIIIHSTKPAKALKEKIEATEGANKGQKPTEHTNDEGNAGLKGSF